MGGAVRDELLGIIHGADFDLVTRSDSAELARLLFDRGVSEIAPVTYERFGTAMVRVQGVDIEIVTARRESYDENSRKPHVEPATYEEDASRRDFTVNTLMRSIDDWELRDPLGIGIADLQAKVLRTPLAPEATFHDDPLRMLRAVRFRWKLGFQPAPGLYEAIRQTRDRLRIISAERIRDELIKMLALPTGPDCLDDLRELGLLEIFAPELLPMVGCEQGSFHHLDVWNHSLLVLRNAGTGDLVLSLAALLHDVGKPPTRFIDEEGNTRFFGHEAVGAKMTEELLRRLKFPQREVDAISLLVKNHMRLGSSPEFTPAAARRLIRDLDGDLERLLQLVEADANGLKAGVRVMDLGPIRKRIAEVQQATPRSTLDSPLSGQEIMEITGLTPGPEVGRLKQALTEMVIEGDLAPGDKASATAWLRDSP
ncbi:CCA tRNA nucleotidyltransferase [Fimbriimonas ginsengisoli]|uniref:CCA tRNA nucleotidyltransferase n=1 Tax=Fimbriimonas ginsengisoli TaxID=1005039 RepID=UPI00130ECA52|nr:HD domain-containing protein [Fimbriimonas ginsengisoli]